MNHQTIKPEQFVSHSPAETQSIGAQLARRLKGGDLVALEGELGAGKTVFVRGLAEGLGLNPRVVSSPTFVIAQEYADPKSGALTLIHIDAYRLRSEHDLPAIGWDEMLADGCAIIAVEWPSRIAAALPAHRVTVRLEHQQNESARLITVEPSEGTLMKRSRSSTLRQQGPVCRKCGLPVDSESPTFPFCSDRCRYADLNAWFGEGYRISRQFEIDDELSE